MPSEPRARLKGVPPRSQSVTRSPFPCDARPVWAQIAHALRQPLQSLDLIARALPGAPSEEIESTATHIAYIAATLQQMTDIVIVAGAVGTREGAGDGRAVSALELDAVTKDVVAALSGPAGRRGLVLEVTAAPAPVTVLCSPAAMRLMVAGVVAAAIVGSTGPIRICCRAYEATGRLVVAGPQEVGDTYRVREAFLDLAMANSLDPPLIAAGLPLVGLMAAGVGGRLASRRRGNVLTLSLELPRSPRT